MDLVKLQIGPEASLDVASAGGSLSLSLSYKGAQASLSLSASIDEVAVLEKLKALLDAHLSGLAKDAVDGGVALAEGALKA